MDDGPHTWRAGKSLRVRKVFRKLQVSGAADGKMMNEYKTCFTAGVAQAWADTDTRRGGVEDVIEF